MKFVHLPEVIVYIQQFDTCGSKRKSSTSLLLFSFLPPFIDFLPTHIHSQYISATHPQVFSQFFACVSQITSTSDHFLHTPASFWLFFCMCVPKRPYLPHKTGHTRKFFEIFLHDATAGHRSVGLLELFPKKIGRHYQHNYDNCHFYKFLTPSYSHLRSHHTAYYIAHSID